MSNRVLLHLKYLKNVKFRFGKTSALRQHFAHTQFTRTRITIDHRMNKCDTSTWRIVSVWFSFLHRTRTNQTKYAFHCDFYLVCCSIPLCDILQLDIKLHQSSTRRQLEARSISYNQIECRAWKWMWCRAHTHTTTCCEPRAVSRRCLVYAVCVCVFCACRAPCVWSDTTSGVASLWCGICCPCYVVMLSLECFTYALRMLRMDKHRVEIQ